MKEFFLEGFEIDDDRAVHLGKGVWWVGFNDEESGLHCNPYLIIEGDEAVVIDGGSRPDFPTVMMKILETGLNPHKIKALIYDHYDPDLCGSIPNFEDMIANPELQIVSSSFSRMFIRHYGARSKFVDISDLSEGFKFSSGRTLEFITTPFCHNRGSYTVFDHKSKILFSGDILGTYDENWRLFLCFPEGCTGKDACDVCANGEVDCRFPGYLAFHRMLMTSSKALHHSLLKLQKLPFEMVAPQHGSVLERKSALFLIEKLLEMNDIGIDQILAEQEAV